VDYIEVTNPNDPAIEQQVTACEDPPNAEYKQALQEAEAEARAAAVPQGNAAQLANADFNQHKWLREEFKPRYLEEMSGRASQAEAQFSTSIGATDGKKAVKEYLKKFSIPKESK